MIHVIATVQLNPGRRDDFLEILRANVPNVLAENGCQSYQPTIDTNSGIPVQAALRADVVTIVEVWDSLEALRNHLQTPHMAQYRDKVKDMVSKTDIKIMEGV